MSVLHSQLLSSAPRLVLFLHCNQQACVFRYCVSLCINHFLSHINKIWADQSGLINYTQIHFSVLMIKLTKVE